MTALRRKDKAGSEAEALALLGDAKVLHLASTTPDGAPLLRALHGVLVDGAVCFHASLKGEKLSCVGRPAVVSAEEIVAELPSWFFHPERACPATTLYRSAMVHGVLEPVEAPEQKAEVLQALMERYQPGGGHRPIRAEDPMYTQALRGVKVLRLRPERVVAKTALMQGKPVEQRAQVVTRLLERGLPGDGRAAGAILDAAPMDPWPERLRGPEGLRFHPWPGPTRAEGCVDLAIGQYWNQGVPREQLRRAHLGAQAWVAAEDTQGRIVATARALADGGKIAYIADVVVAEPLRGRGVGAALIQQLLAHPGLRGVRRALLHTLDGGPFYARQGFVPMEGRESWAFHVP
ncbi:MAG: GNAT family N-acetyltransferase [Alphaproteobacteria bacterium]|nr:GNAT family N-acetyltransferase [Alphaproteobacteria bacterium]